MSRPVWISGNELATIWVSRIAMNMPTAMAKNPTQVLIPTMPAGAENPVTPGISQPSPRREDVLLDPDAPEDQHQIEDRKCRSDRDRPERERQQGDLGDYQQVVRVPQPAERAGAHQGRAGYSDNPCRPITAQGGNYPEPPQLKQPEEAEQRPDRRGCSGDEEAEACQPAGVQQNEIRVTFAVRLDSAQLPQPDGVATGPNQLDNALQQDEAK